MNAYDKLEAFRTALSIVLRNEGGYVNDPDDPGGATNFGVTQGTYDTYRVALRKAKQPVKYISQHEVEDIYDDFWFSSGCDKLATFDVGLAIAHFDCAINCGPETAIRLLQRTCKVKEDGKLGPITIEATRLIYRPQLYSRLIHQRNRYYARVCVNRPRSIKFLEGWLQRTYELRVTIQPYERTSS